MRLSQVFAVAAALVSASSASPIRSRDNPNFPDPTIDPFYKTPANITKYNPGQIIRQREVPTLINVNFSKAYQVLLRTTDGQGRPTSTVSTIWVPLFPAYPGKIFSYQVPEDSDTLDCNPSWGWVLNSASNAGIAQKFLEGPIVIGWGLSQGYYVVNTDAEGPDSAWLVGKTEGQAGLDGIRATMNLAKLSAADTAIALFGYSGGAHTTIWMSTLAAQYAPELKLAGAAYGGTPIDLRAGYDLVNGGPNSIVAGGAIFGLANGYAGPGSNPDLNATVNSFLTPEGKKIAAMFRANNYCIPSETLPARNYSTLFVGGDPLNNPDTVAVLAKESLLSNVSSVQPVPVPKFPRFQYHGLADNIVPYGPNAAYVQQQCKNGANIQFWSLQGLDHYSAYFAGFIGAISFVQQSLAGSTPQVPCGFPTTTSSQTTASLPAPGSSMAVRLLGQELSNKLANATAKH